MPQITTRPVVEGNRFGADLAVQRNEINGAPTVFGQPLQ
jgi:hypothetical protein